MININCSLECCFESEGKCVLTHAIYASSTPHPQCVYFRPKDVYISKSTPGTLNFQK